MKKFIAIIILTALPLHAQFVDNEDKLAYELFQRGNEAVVEYQHQLKKRGVRYDDIYSTGITFTVTGRTVMWDLELKSNTTYIFHTFTTTATVIASVRHDGNFLCGMRIKKEGVFTFRSGKAGVYTLSIRTIAGEHGLHYTSVMYLLKSGEKYIWER